MKYKYLAGVEIQPEPFYKDPNILLSFILDNFFIAIFSLAILLLLLLFFRPDRLSIQDLQDLKYYIEITSQIRELKLTSDSKYRIYIENNSNYSVQIIKTVLKHKGEIVTNFIAKNYEENIASSTNKINRNFEFYMENVKIGKFQRWRILRIFSSRKTVEFTNLSIPPHSRIILTSKNFKAPKTLTLKDHQGFYWDASPNKVRVSPQNKDYLLG